MKFGSWRLMPGPPNVTTVCGTSSGMNARCGGLAASTSATGVRLALAGNPPKVWSSNLPSVAGSTSPTTAILQRILRQHAADIVLHVGDIDLRHAFQGAVGLPAIGVVAKGDFQKLAAGERGRIGGVAPQPGNHLRANAFDIVALEMRRCQRHPQQVEGLVPVVLEHAQRAAEIIARRTEAQFDGAAVEALVEGLGIQIARAFVEQPRRPDCRRRACRPDPASRRRRRHIPSRSAARWRPARTRPRCRRVKPDAGSWPRPARAPTPAAHRQAGGNSECDAPRGRPKG